MNLATRDIRHNKLRFALTGMGLGLLLALVVSMAGIYEGALEDALSLPRSASADLWVVQPRTKRPFAEPSAGGLVLTEVAKGVDVVKHKDAAAMPQSNI
ncbi:hypothetical protein [Bradyrhizobium sp.]|uniref:hypothetical protein n=1 Tax=Bradyrhizobium sp. TaxID=376 RepID=UPI003C790B78